MLYLVVNLKSKALNGKESSNITAPAVFREDISLTCFKLSSELFIKVLQVVLTEQALETHTLV